MFPFIKLRPTHSCILHGSQRVLHEFRIIFICATIQNSHTSVQCMKCQSVNVKVWRARRVLFTMCSCLHFHFHFRLIFVTAFIGYISKSKMRPWRIINHNVCVWVWASAFCLCRKMPESHAYNSKSILLFLISINSLWLMRTNVNLGPLPFPIWFWSTYCEQMNGHSRLALLIWTIPCIREFSSLFTVYRQ